MGKKGLTFEFKSRESLLEYDSSNRDNTTYLFYHHGLVRAATLKPDKHGRLQVDDGSNIYADTLPMLTMRELKERYFVRFCYLYGKNKQYTVAEGEVKDCLVGGASLSNSKLRNFLGVFWKAPNSPNYWVDSNDLVFVSKGKSPDYFVF
jgi:hypothetical protein